MKHNLELSSLARQPASPVFSSHIQLEAVVNSTGSFNMSLVAEHLAGHQCPFVLEGIAVPRCLEHSGLISDSAVRAR